MCSFWAFRQTKEFFSSCRKLDQGLCVHFKTKLLYRIISNQRNTSCSTFPCTFVCSKEVKALTISLCSGSYLSRDLLEFDWFNKKLEFSPRSLLFHYFWVKFIEIIASEALEMGSAEAELNNLALNLKKVEEKFLQWTGDCLKTSLLEGKQIHENILLDRRGEETCLWSVLLEKMYCNGPENFHFICKFVHLSFREIAAPGGVDKQKPNSKRKDFRR